MSSESDELKELVRANLRKLYTETVIEHSMNPRNLGEVPDADGSGKITGPCGDTMEIWLKVRNGVITKASFLTDGCGTTLASGSMATEIVKGKSVPSALKITSQDVLNALGGLPEESVHCAVLATNTLRDAIKNYLTFKNEPWKKAYRK